MNRIHCISEHKEDKLIGRWQKDILSEKKMLKHRGMVEYLTFIIPDLQ